MDVIIEKEKDEKGQIQNNNANDSPENKFESTDNLKDKKEPKFQVVQTKKNEDEITKKKEEVIIFPKEKNYEDNKINRFSNLKENEFPLEDKIQIQKQVDNDNDNESEQIEVLENILNNFGKEKYKNTFLKNNTKKTNINKLKSMFNCQNNSIINKIKHDIALIKFEQTLNSIYNKNKYNNDLGKRNEIKNKSKEKNILRIEKIKNLLFSEMNVGSKLKSISNHTRNENKVSINTKFPQERNFYNSCHDFYKRKSRKHIINQFYNDSYNIREIKINNFNINPIYNNYYDTFRSRILDADNYNKINLFNDINNKAKNKRSTVMNEPIKSNLGTSNQFFFDIYTNSMSKYPYLYLLRNKINKMRKEEISRKYSKKEKKEEENKNEEPKLSILEKINEQKILFMQEIDKCKNKN